MAARGGRLFVMYGQTESTARMSYVPPDRLPEKAHCVGIPIRDSSFSIRVGDEETQEPGVEGEVIFRGPSVMIGYAEHREDLARGTSSAACCPPATSASSTRRASCS